MLLSQQQIIDRIRPVLQRNRVVRAGLFGSVVRNDASPTSDVDLLVECAPGTSLFGFIGLKQELEELLGTQVELVEYAAIKPQLRDRILASEVRFRYLQSSTWFTTSELEPGPG